MNSWAAFWPAFLIGLAPGALYSLYIWVRQVRADGRARRQRAAARGTTDFTDDEVDAQIRAAYQTIDSVQAAQKRRRQLGQTQEQLL